MSGFVTGNLPAARDRKTRALPGALRRLMNKNMPAVSYCAAMFHNYFKLF
jgi:hypothetical protein